MNRPKVLRIKSIKVLFNRYSWKFKTKYKIDKWRLQIAQYHFTQQVGFNSLIGIDLEYVQ